MISKETELTVSLPTAVTEISVTLGTGHVVTPFCSLDVDLAFWTLLGIPLPVLNLIGPVTQQLVSLFVLFAVNTFMPGRVALETPDKLARWTLDFVFVLQFGRGRNVASPPEGCKVLALRAWLRAGVDAAEFQEIFILDNVLMGQVIEDSCFIQVFAALCDRAFYICLSQLHLGAEVPLEALLTHRLLAAGQGLDGLLLQAHAAAQHQQRPEVAADQPGEGFGQQVQVHHLDAAARRQRVAARRYPAPGRGLSAAGAGRGAGTRPVVLHAVHGAIHVPPGRAAPTAATLRPLLRRFPHTRRLRPGRLLFVLPRR